MEYTKAAIDGQYERLTQRAFVAKEGTPGQRFEILREAMDFFDVLQEGQDVAGADKEAIGKTSGQLRNNLTRLLGYKPSAVDGFVVKSKVVRDLAYFQEQVTGIERAMREEQDAHELYKRIPLIAHELDAAAKIWRASDEKAYAAKEKGRSAGDRKKEKLYHKLLTEVLPGVVENAVQFGYASKFSARFAVQSDDETLPSLQETIERHEGREEDLRFLIDKTHPGHPPWFIFMQGAEEQFVRTATVFKGTLVSRGESGPLDVKLPIVHCEGFECQFDGLPKYKEAYIDALVNFMRSSDFAARTGYEGVALMGLHRTVPREQIERLGLQKLDRIYGQGRWVQPWGVAIKNKDVKLMLGVPAKKAPSLLGSEWELLKLEWGLKDLPQ